MHSKIIDILYHSTSKFQIYSSVHWIMLLIAIGIVVSIIYLGKRGFRDEGNIFRYSMIAILVVQQFLLYSWYFANGMFNAKDALPLYPCRIWQLSALLLLLTMDDRYYAVSYLMGLPSGIVAFLVADTGGLGFPNVMFIQFFLGHLSILAVPIYMKFCRGKKLEKNMLYTCFKVFFAYVCIAGTTNYMVGGNYGYVSKPPYENAFFLKLTSFYPVLYICFAMTVLVGWYALSVRLEKANKSSFCVECH